MWKCAKQSTFYYLEIRWQCRFQQKWKKYWTKMLLKELRPKMPAGYYYHFLNLATRWDWMCKSEEESEKHKKQSDLEWINLILVIHGYSCTLCFMSHFFFASKWIITVLKSQRLTQHVSVLLLQTAIILLIVPKVRARYLHYLAWN